MIREYCYYRKESIGTCQEKNLAAKAHSLLEITVSRHLPAQTATKVFLRQA
jgi:hypothetical protein